MKPETRATIPLRSLQWIRRTTDSFRCANVGPFFEMRVIGTSVAGQQRYRREMMRAGYSKRPRFSPAQPRRLFHPPALSLPRQPLHPRTRLVPSKAAASYHLFLRGGWARAFRFPNFPRGSRKIVLHCAHRATTALPWGLCEQEERSACSLTSF
jgi:hypothetical protein